MTILTQASTQWASRPSDERFLSLPELHQFKVSQKESSKAGVVPNRVIEVQPEGDDHKGLVITGPNGGAVNPTHWSFGQLASLAGAPASYLRKLPTELVADCMNYGLQVTRDVEDIGVLLYKNGGEPELRAATGPNYGRVWDADVVERLMSYVGDGVTGDWRVPGEFGKPVTVNRSNTTLYASDRDMFVFLADEKNLIEVPDRRNGQTGLMSRGFFLWNSEVGSKTFGISTFLFDYVCMNRIVWGAKDVQTVTIRHSSGAPHRFLEEAVPALEAYSQSSASGVQQAVIEAKAKRVDDIDDFLAKRKFNKRQVDLIKLTHQAEEGRPMETIWDVSTGITAMARTIEHVDARVDMEREAGKIFELAQ